MKENITVKIPLILLIILTGCCYYFSYGGGVGGQFVLQGTGLLLTINSIFLILFFIFLNKIRIVYLRLPLYLLVGVTFFYTYMSYNMNVTITPGQKGVIFEPLR